MIILDFFIEPDAFVDDNPDHPIETSPLFLETLYYTPIRMCVNGVEMYNNVQPYPVEHGDHYGSVQLVGFVLDSLNLLDSLADGETHHINMDSGWDIYYERHGDMVNVYSCDVSKEHAVTVPIAEVREALLAFKERVRLLLIEKVPAIQKNPAWKEWFPENV